MGTNKPKWQNVRFREYLPDAIPAVSLEPLETEIPQDTKDIKRRLSRLGLEKQALQLALSKANVTDASGRRVGSVQYHTWRDQVLERFHATEQQIISLKLALKERSDADREFATRTDYDPRDPHEVIRELRGLAVDLYMKLGQPIDEQDQDLLDDARALMKDRPGPVKEAPR